MAPKKSKYVEDSESESEEESAEEESEEESEPESEPEYVPKKGRDSSKMSYAKSAILNQESCRYPPYYK